LDLIAHGAVAELRLNRPPANALNPALVRDLIDALAKVSADGARGILLSGQPGIFSGGLDVPELLMLGRDSISAFWADFFALMRALASSPVPVVAAIEGHSPAGGAVLALHCDYRIGVEGSFRLGFNEVLVGLPVPATILLALEDLVGSRRARDLAVRGRLVDMAEALQLGLVDELAKEGEVVARACALAGELAALPSIAMNQTRLACKRRLLRALEQGNDADSAARYWFSQETQAAMRRLAERLSGG
jgi:enoyl-CoA hydratase/carnithine racemase